MPIFPFLHQQGCDLGVAISIYRVQSSCPQLLIALACPCISLDNFCLVCKWIQLLSQHTGPSLCPVAFWFSKGPPAAITDQCPQLAVTLLIWELSCIWYTTVSANPVHLVSVVLLRLCSAPVLKAKCWKKYWEWALLGLCDDEVWWGDIYSVQRLFRVPFLSWKEKSSASGRWLFSLVCGFFVVVVFLLFLFLVFFAVLPISLQYSGQIELDKPGITKSRRLNVSDFFSTGIFRNLLLEHISF